MTDQTGRAISAIGKVCYILTWLQELTPWQKNPVFQILILKVFNEIKIVTF